MCFIIGFDIQVKARAGSGRAEESHRRRIQKPRGSDPGHETEARPGSGGTVRSAGTGPQGESAAAGGTERSGTKYPEIILQLEQFYCNICLLK